MFRACLVLAAVSLALVAPAKAQFSTEAVIRGIQGYVCDWDYWREFPPRSGRTYPLTIGRQGPWAVAWVEGSDVLPNLPDIGLSKNEAQFFVLGRKFEQAVVLQITYYKIGEPRPMSIHEDHKEKRFEGPTESAAFTEPTACPSPAASTPLKQRIASAIAESTRKQLTSFNKLPGFANKYPKNLEVVVGSFTVASHFVEIYVPPTHSVFRVALHNFQSPIDDDYVPDGDFPFGQIYRPTPGLIPKIQRDGTRHKIVLGE
jgi:hypothetical protein